MKMPENVMKLLNDKEASKVLTTVDSNGIPHSIVVGSMMAPAEDMLCAAEVLMKKTAENLKTNKNIAILAVKGMESYSVNGTVIQRQVSGDLFETVAEELKKVGLPTQAVWTFKPTAIFNQSAGPDAGKKIL